MPSFADIDRRRLLIGGGAGIGLVVGYALWPRVAVPNLTAAPGEHVFGGWLKIGEDGHVTVAVPQLEHGQGSWTALPQLIADELGADWRTVAVEPAPASPLYANPLGLEALFEGRLDRALDAPRVALMATVGSSSVRQFAPALIAAGATARVLLCMAAAARTDVRWQDCRTAAGFVHAGAVRLRFGELAAAAARLTPPTPVPLRGEEGLDAAAERPERLLGKPLPRLDAPAKVDGSAGFAGDVRLPDMVFAALRSAPPGADGPPRVDRAAADRVPGAQRIVATDGWVAAIGQTWWAAGRALDAARPRWSGGGGMDGAAIDRALTAALDGPGERIAGAGDLSALFRGARVYTADYRIAAGQHAALETATATARFADGRLELWTAAQAPGATRATVAGVLGIDPDAVVLHNMLAGGAFGERLETAIAAQAAYLARELGRPVQLVRSRAEDLRATPVRAPAHVRLSARLAQNGQLAGWLCKVAAPATGHVLADRLLGADTRARIAGALAPGGDPYVLGGARPPYQLTAWATDHHPVELDIAAGHFRSGGHLWCVFARECFLDELAHAASSEPVSYRIGMLGGEPRLARCLSTAAALGGWEGGVPGSGQGIAAHVTRGSRIAVLAEARYGDGGRPVVDRLVAAVDCGRVVNPELVRQQVEGGLLLGLAAATGAAPTFVAGRPIAKTLGALALPRLADTPDITVELLASDADYGGVSELGIPAVAPAIANALQAASGVRVRHLPLRA